MHGTFLAHVLAARLASEGIDVELRGALGAAYGLTVGDIARVDLYVPAEQVDDARLVLLACEIDAALDLHDLQADGFGHPDLRHDPCGDPVGRGRLWPWVVTLVLVVASVAAPVLRYVSD